MDDIARLSSADRIDLFTASAAKRRANVIVIEKDFWVCWVLKQIFGLKAPPADLIFKGGTSLSKVWGVIDRFSEDVDLSFNRGDLGFRGDSDPANAKSTKKRNQQLDELSKACSAIIHDVFAPQLMKAFEESLEKAAGDQWRLEIDPDEQQTILFHYPTGIVRRTGNDAAYLRPLLDETLVLWVGEFGHAPRFNANAGRDHWGQCFSVALAGGGVRGGVVHGKSDEQAAYPISGRVEPRDLHATMFHLLGHSPDTELRYTEGRPLPLSRGQVIAEIL